MPFICACTFLIIITVFLREIIRLTVCDLGVIWLSIGHMWFKSVSFSQNWQTLETSSNTAQLAQILTAGNAKIFWFSFSTSLDLKTPLFLYLLTLTHIAYNNNAQQMSSLIQFNSIQFNSIQFNSIQFNSIQFNSIQCDRRSETSILKFVKRNNNASSTNTTLNTMI